MPLTVKYAVSFDKRLISRIKFVLVSNSKLPRFIPLIVHS